MDEDDRRCRRRIRALDLRCLVVGDGRTSGRRRTHHASSGMGAKPPSTTTQAPKRVVPRRSRCRGPGRDKKQPESSGRVVRPRTGHPAGSSSRCHGTPGQGLNSRWATRSWGRAGVEAAANGLTRCGVMGRRRSSSRRAAADADGRGRRAVRAAFSRSPLATRTRTASARQPAGCGGSALACSWRQRGGGSRPSAAPACRVAASSTRRRSTAPATPATCSTTSAAGRAGAAAITLSCTWAAKAAGSLSHHCEPRSSMLHTVTVVSSHHIAQPQHMPPS